MEAENDLGGWGGTPKSFRLRAHMDNTRVEEFSAKLTQMEQEMERKGIDIHLSSDPSRVTQQGVAESESVVSLSKKIERIRNAFAIDPLILMNRFSFRVIAC